MDPLKLLVEMVVILWFGAVAVGIARAWNARPAPLRPITAQTHDRFNVQWDRIVREFVDMPSEAAREAEYLVYNLLEARGQPTGQSHLPPSMQEARRWAGRGRRGGTEDLRQAMLHYRDAFEDLIGRRPETA